MTPRHNCVLSKPIWNPKGFNWMMDGQVANSMDVHLDDRWPERAEGHVTLVCYRKGVRSTEDIKDML